MNQKLVIIMKKKNNKQLDVLKGLQNIKENIFIYPIRKQKIIRKYNTPWLSEHMNSKIYIFLKNNENSNKWTGLLHLMFGRISFMRRLTKNTKPLIIWVWPTNFKKKIPKKGNIITEDNINSGSTTIYLNNNKYNGEICLWRKEEILKVLLHEIIHSFRMDAYEPSPKEAYVEYKAVLANIYLELLERHMSLNKVNYLIKKEKEFGIEQCKKILNYDPGNTNVIAYLSERNRLLCNIHKNNWKKYIFTKKIKPMVSSDSLRFTITDIILENEGQKEYIIP